MKTNATTNKQIIELLKIRINSIKERSAYKRGMLLYAIELLDQMDDDIDYCNRSGIECAYDLTAIDKKALEKLFLNGADNWFQYSEGGCSLIADYDIAKRLCNPSEFKKSKEGYNNPTGSASWIMLQSRALRQAFANIWYQYNELKDQGSFK